MEENLNEELPKLPNKKYEIFFDKFKEISILNVSEWKVPHLLGYFCKKYKETYNIEYSWKFNTPLPSKCFECFQIKALSSKLSSNPKILKEYIDWVFEIIVPTTKAKFRSISFLTKDDTVNNYKFNILLASQTQQQVNRTTNLPITYYSILEENGYSSIKTYGDLSFAAQLIPIPDKLVLAFEQLKNQGFDKNILTKIV